MAGGNRDHMANRIRAPGGKPLGPRIRAIIGIARGFDHPASGVFIDLGKPVQRAADGCWRQAKLAGKILEVHLVRLSKRFETLGP